MSDAEVVLSRPHFAAEEALALARRHYGLGRKAEELPSYSDRNFLVSGDGDERFVLKIANALEERPGLEAQNGAMAHLAAAGLPVPQVVPGRYGAGVDVVEGAGGREHLVRLLTYLPGVPLADVHPRLLPLMHDLGRFLGRVSRALSTFDHAGTRREMIWDLVHARPTVEERLACLRGDGETRLIAHFLDLFGAIAEPLLPGLRRSVVHNDANDFNVLVDGPENADRRVVGLIDFGDLVHTITVAEIAIAAAYAMLDSPDPIRTAAAMIGSYHADFPLTEEEIRVLFPLIAMRLCMSVCISGRQGALDPDNEHVTVSRAHAWHLLSVLEGVHPRLAEYVFRGACGLEPCPPSLEVVEWLRSHEAAPVVRPDPRTSRVLPFDFGVQSGDWSFDEVVEPGRAEDEIRRRMQAIGAATGVGRYGEARLCYGGDQFASASERRTIHLGMDLFQEAGSAVYAPFDAVVYSIANDDRPYDFGPTVVLRHDPPGGPTFHTLFGHLSRASLRELHPGRRLACGEAFAFIGSRDENGGWAPHVHVQLIADMLDRQGDFPGAAEPWMRDVWQSISPDASLIVGLGEKVSPDDGDDLMRRRRRWIGPSLRLAYRHPITLGRGYRHVLYDRNGQAYLDTVNNVAHVGHAHAVVVEAARRKMRVLNTNTRYLYAELTRYAERLMETLPEPLRVCYIVNSGSEANDLALRLAGSFTGRDHVVVLDHAYHGNLSSLIAVSPYKFDGPGGGGRPPHTHVAPVPDPFRGQYRDEDSGERYAALVDRELMQAGDRAAAFLTESAMGCAGQVFYPPGFLVHAYERARARGAVCIADEVQTGLGRVGDAFWAFQLQGVVPDVVTMGKPIGNGHPLGAVVTSREIAEAFDDGMEYFNSFGGNPVSCAIGLAVLDVIENEALQEHARKVGGYLIGMLRDLAGRRPIIGDVRGAGLFIGVELVRDDDLNPASEETEYVIERMRERGILAGRDGPHLNVLKIKPPLVFDRAAADRYVDVLDDVLSEDFVRARLAR